MSTTLSLGGVEHPPKLQTTSNYTELHKNDPKLYQTLSKSQSYGIAMIQDYAIIRSNVISYLI